MRVRHLSLTDFRNYRSADLALDPGVTVLVGSNGQGKTNLVEAIGYLSALSSHRVSADSALIRAGADSAIVRARVQFDEREVLVELQINRSGANRAQVNRAAARTRDLPRYFASVLFAPEDMALVRGEPAGRRRFLDQLLVLRTPRLAGVQGDYDRVLRQRNSLLKSARASGLRGSAPSTLEVWDERLVALGSELIDARDQLLQQLLPHVREAYSTVAGADHALTMTSYLSILSADQSADPDSEPPTFTSQAAASSARPTAESFAVALREMRRRELERGITLVGPHRDDVLFGLNGLPAKGYASHGESWSFALALKLASAELLRAESALGDPVLILDDVFAELDDRRRHRLAAAIQSYEQVLITAAVRGDVPEELVTGMVTIAAGSISVSQESANSNSDREPIRGASADV